MDLIMQKGRPPVSTVDSISATGLMNPCPIEDLRSESSTGEFLQQIRLSLLVLGIRNDPCLVRSIQIQKFLPQG